MKKIVRVVSSIIDILGIGIVVSLVSTVASLLVSILVGVIGGALAMLIYYLVGFLGAETKIGALPFSVMIGSSVFCTAVILGINWLLFENFLEKVKNRWVLGCLLISMQMGFSVFAMWEPFYLISKLFGMERLMPWWMPMMMGLCAAIGVGIWIVWAGLRETLRRQKEK